MIANIEFQDDNRNIVVSPYPHRINLDLGEFELRVSGVRLILKSDGDENAYNFNMLYRASLNKDNSWSIHRPVVDDVVIVDESDWSNLEQNEDLSHFSRIHNILESFYQLKFDFSELNNAYLSRLAMQRDNLKLSLDRIDKDEEAFRNRKVS